MYFNGYTMTGMKGPQRGVALVTALLVVSLVTVAAVAMATRQQVDVRRTANLLHGEQAYAHAVSAESWARVVLRRDELANAVRRVSLLASDRYGKAIKVQLLDGKLELSSQTEMGEAQESLSVEYEGDEIQIGFNARYLLDYLGVVGSDLVSLELNPTKEGEEAQPRSEAGDKPGQLRPEPEGDMAYRYIVMPMHL